MDGLRVHDLLDLSKTQAAPLLERVAYPWLALPMIGDFIAALGASLPKDEYEQIAAQVWVAKDARVFPSAYLAGPAIIGHESELRHSAFIRGGALVGAGAVVGNSVELKNCILFDGVQVPHFNYVGDSILGCKAHMGAGAVTSNVRADKAAVAVHAGERRIDTGLAKFGAILGDYAEIGCNSVLNPGVVVGRGAVVYPTSCVRACVPARSIHKNTGVVVAMESRVDK